MSVSLPDGTPMDLQSAALPAVGHIALTVMRDHFPRESERERQVMALAEEAGEFTGAYRRWVGLARRTGGWDDVEAELADVLITAHVTAAAFGTIIQPVDFPADPQPYQYAAVMEVAARAGNVVAQYLGDGCGPSAGFDAMLSLAADAAWRAARHLGIDLDAAWRAKAETVFTRGWRDARPTGIAGGGA